MHSRRIAGRAPRSLAGLAVVVALLLLGLPAAAGAQGVAPPTGGDAGLAIPGIQGEAAAQADFGSDIRFQLRLRGEDPVTSVLFLYQVDDSRVQNTAVPSFQPGTTVTATYTWRVAGVLLPGTEVRYQWLVETASGRRATTTERSVAYEDTRLPWREAKGEGITVFYPTADPQSGPALLDEAKKTQDKLKNDFGLTLDTPLRIYAYSRREDYVSAVYTGQPLEQAMTAGSDRIFVLAAGGTSGMTPALQGLRREIATVLFAQKTKNAYAAPPQWLALGFSYVMGGDELPPETLRALGQRAQANRLLSLRTLGGNFPTNEGDFSLAYAESASAVQYIASTYGAEKLRALLAAFKDGNTVDDAMKKGLGVTLDQFETRWKNALKSGQAGRPATGQSPTAPTTTTGDGGVVDRLFGPALRFWQGVFGPRTPMILLGVGGVVGLGIVALVVSTGVSIWRRAHDTGED
jgi:hypothetical protein